MLADIKLILETALVTPGQIHVIRAAPGEGKSYNTVRALAYLVRSKHVSRVLWAVKETNSENSLGAEAVKELRGQGLNPQLVLGKKAFTTQYQPKTGAWRKVKDQAYTDQFTWSPEPSVKVISHAHLPLVFGKAAWFTPKAGYVQLRDAQLLIIDEDPTESFLIDEQRINQRPEQTTKFNLRLNSTFFQGAKDEVSQALLRIMGDVETGKYDQLAKSWGLGHSRTYSLTGDSFWKALDSLLTPAASWKDFNKKLSKTIVGKHPSTIPPWVASTMHQALKDYRRGLSPSAQFGVMWFETDKGRPSVEVRFRFNVNQYRPFPISTVILDAYAQKSIYEHALAPSPVHIHDVGTSAVLQVESVPGMGRSRSKTKTNKQPQHTLSLMETMVEFARQNGNTLLLSFQDSKIEGYGPALKQALDLSPLPNGKKIELHHWKAGRGSNTWKGWNVIALEEFAMPKAVAYHALTSFVPAASASAQKTRDRLISLLTASETLQMLHRSRQTIARREGWPHTPRVITLYEPKLGELNGQVNLKPAVGLAAPGRRTTSPRLEQGVAEFSAELAVLLGGVPLITLQALGWDVPAKVGQPERLNLVRERLRLLISDSSATLPLLRYWSNRGKLKGYEDTPPHRDNSRLRLKEAIKRVNPTFVEFTDVHPAKSAPGLKSVRQTVLAETALAAQSAVDLLLSEV